MKKVKYDSKFEKRLAEGVLRLATYHPPSLLYTVPSRVARYEPDFVYLNYVIESKGRFRPGEANKYFPIRDTIAAQGKTFVFCFMDPNTPMPGSKKRKNGTRFTMKEWAEKNNFLWYTEPTIGDILK